MLPKVQKQAFNVFFEFGLKLLQLFRSSLMQGHLLLERCHLALVSIHQS